MINVGIEYELEGVFQDPDDMGPLDGWICAEDGTLRGGGMEFVLDGKQTIDSAKDCITTLLSELDGNFTVSHRCSTHIHVDTTSLSYRARIALVLGLIIHDDAFFAYGMDRKHNNYCCPVLYSPTALLTINGTQRAPSINGHRRAYSEAARKTLSLYDTDVKYLSINPMPLHVQGSIELRHFVPLIDENQAYAVLDLIASIYEIAESVPVRGEDAVTEVWERYGDRNPQYRQAVGWTIQMYKLHNQMAVG